MCWHECIGRGKGKRVLGGGEAFRGVKGEKVIKEMRVRSRKPSLQRNAGGTRGGTNNEPSPSTLHDREERGMEGRFKEGVIQERTGCQEGKKAQRDRGVEKTYGRSAERGAKRKKK